MRIPGDLGAFRSVVPEHEREVNPVAALSPFHVGIPTLVALVVVGGDNEVVIFAGIEASRRARQTAGRRLW